MREMPHNFEAEQALLGAILASNSAYHRVSDMVDRAHFADPLHGQIYDAMAKIIDRGQQASVFALKSYLDANPDAKTAGGGSYLAKLLASSINAMDARQVGRIVRDLHLRRQLIALGTDVVNEAYADSPDRTAVEQIETVERHLYELATTGQSEGGFQSFAKAMTGAITTADAAYRRDVSVVGIPTGLGAIDHHLGGLHRSDLVILAGRPSMGKTALATNIAFNVAKAWRQEERDGERVTVDGGVVGFFSLEMSSEQLATRIIAEQANVASERIRRGQVNAREFDQVMEKATELERLPLYIDDTPALSVSALRTRARRLKRQHGLHLLVVDYLQLIQAPRDVEGRVNQVSEITRGLKTLAKELDVPVLALSQLSRAVEQREDKRPQLADLRDSGSIEQDADVVAFVFREEYYTRQDEPRRRADETDSHFADRMTRWQTHMMQCSGRAEVLIEKQRHGPTGKCLLRFDGATTRFSDLDVEP